MNILNYIGFLEGEISNLDALVEKIIIYNKGIILTKIKLRLYQKSIDGDGNEILPSYTMSTTVAKKAKLQISSRVTLRDTGEFYKSFYVTYVNGFIKINSDLDKTDFLVEKYGNSILDLTNDEIVNIIQSIIEPEIIRRINRYKKINLKL